MHPSKLGDCARLDSSWRTSACSAFWFLYINFLKIQVRGSDKILWVHVYHKTKISKHAFLKMGDWARYLFTRLHASTQNQKLTFSGIVNSQSGVSQALQSPLLFLSPLMKIYPQNHYIKRSQLLSNIPIRVCDSEIGPTCWLLDSRSIWCSLSRSY